MDYKPKQNEHKQDQDQFEDTLLEESPLTQTDEDDVVREYTNG